MCNLEYKNLGMKTKCNIKRSSDGAVVYLKNEGRRFEYPDRPI